jgi:outer membrane protein OmpA-like peptidoglycan-associated protein
MLRKAFLSAILLTSGLTHAAAQPAPEDGEPPAVSAPEAQAPPGDAEPAPKKQRGERPAREQGPAKQSEPEASRPERGQGAEKGAERGDKEDKPRRRDRDAAQDEAGPPAERQEKATPAPRAAEPTLPARSEPDAAETPPPPRAEPEERAPRARAKDAEPAPAAEKAQPAPERSTQDAPPKDSGNGDAEKKGAEKAAPSEAPDKGERPPREKSARDKSDREKQAPPAEEAVSPTPPRAEPAAPIAADPAAPVEKKQTMMPTDERKAKEVIREERAKADVEFERAKKAAGAAGGKDAPRVDPAAASRFEKVRGQRKERIEKGGVAVIEEPDKRVIVRSKDKAFIQHDEGQRLGRSAREVRRERKSDGTTIVVNLGGGGIEITSIFNDRGQLLRRSRQDRGREIVLIDNRDYYNRHQDRYYDPYVDLPPPVIRIPRDRYVVDYDGASERDVYDALMAPPVERLQRGYSLEEVRRSYPLRQRMPRVDLDTINFAFASWDVDPAQYPKLERVADAMKRIIDRNPDEIFMIEGHTDAVGSDIDNLSLSDRRAETVAIILSDTFRVPPENLVTQGYGEEFLKVNTQAPSRENRRVAVRRITPLLSRR